MGGRPNILTLLHAVSCAMSIEEAGATFALLANEDFEAAAALATVLARAMPNSDPLWTAILDRAREKGCDPGQTPAKAFRWGAKDAAQTADSIDRFLRREGPWRMRQ